MGGGVGRVFRRRGSREEGGRGGRRRDRRGWEEMGVGTEIGGDEMLVGSLRDFLGR